MDGIYAERKISLRNGFQNLAGIVRNFDQHLACDLEGVGELVYMDMDSGLSQLREGLSRILKNRTPLEKAHECAPFFEAYKSPEGKELSEESVRKLAALASSFPSGEEASRNEVALERKYAEDPKSFWDLLSPPRDLKTLSIIRHISESFDEQQSLNPIRRRIILSILFEKVQFESYRLQARGNLLQQGQTYKGAINNALLNSLWDSTDESTKRKKHRFCRNVRAGGKWNRLEPGVLIGLAHHQAWTTWERSMTDDELEAISAYIGSLQSYQRWKDLSPLVLKLKSAFLSYHTRASGNIVQSFPSRRKRAGEDRDLQGLKRRAKWSLFNVHGDAQDAVLTQGSSQSHTPGPHTVSNMNGSLQVLAGVATGLVSSEYSPPPVDTSFMNDFDISAGPPTVLQPPPLIHVSSMNGTNHFDISAGLPLQPPLGNFFPDASRNFDLPNGQSYQQDFIDGSSFGNGMNDFDISAGRENVLNPMGDARFQQPINTS